jgi:hypothetical protein
MADKKNSADLLNSRMRAVTGHAKPAAIKPFGGKPPLSSKSGPERPPRQARFKRGEIMLETGLRLQVVVKNLSETGARIDFHEGGTDIFGRVQLIEPSVGLKRWARVVWKDQASAGLKFEN